MTLQEIAEQKALEENKERELEHSLKALEARQKVQLKAFKEFHTTTPTKQEQL